MRKDKLLGIGMIVVLFLALLAPMASAEAEAVDIYVVEIGHKNLTFIEKVLSYLYIFGDSGIQLGKGSARHGDPPVLDNPTTSFKKGETIGLIFTARDVREGSELQFQLCKQGGTCTVPRIGYRNGVYTGSFTIEGNWDVWWVVTAFSAPEEGTYDMRAWEYIQEIWGSELVTSKTFTVQGLTCQPNTRVCDNGFAKICEADGSGWSYEYCWHGCSGGYCNPTPTPTPTPTVAPNPCQGVTCQDYCSGNLRYFSGYCSGGNCYYSSQTCPYGCSGGVCNPDICQGVTCPDDCSGDTRLYNGYCSGGSCQYSQTNCDYGCSGGACNVAPPKPPVSYPSSWKDMLSMFWDWLLALF